MKDERYDSVFREDITLASARTIRLNREKRSISQAMIASLTGMDQSYISNIENGNCLVSIEKFCILSLAMGIGLKDCFDKLTDEIGSITVLRKYYTEKPELFSRYPCFRELVRRNMTMETLDIESLI